MNVLGTGAILRGRFRGRSYRIQAELGGGGEDRLYRALWGDRPVAIRVAPATAIITELHWARRLPPGLIPPVLDYDSHAAHLGMAFLVRALPGCETLADRLRAGNLTPVAVRLLGENLATVMGSLHRLGTGLGRLYPGGLSWDPLGERWWILSLAAEGRGQAAIRGDLEQLAGLLRLTGVLDWDMGWAAAAAAAGRLDGVGSFLGLWRRRGAWTLGALAGGLALFFLGLAVRG